MTNAIIKTVIYLRNNSRKRSLALAPFTLRIPISRYRWRVSKTWNAKYTVRYPIFYILDFRRIYRSSLYASGKNGIYPIQHID